MEGTSSPI